MNTLESIVRAGGFNTPAYYRAIRAESKNPPVVTTEPEPYPVPERTSRDPWPDGLEIPGPVAAVKSEAESAGWVARVDYSRGRLPHGTTGKPGRTAGWFGLQAFHPETRARLVATYEDATPKWDAVHLMTRNAITSRGTITDARAFLRVAGRVAPSLAAWVDARIAVREEAAAARAAAKPAKPKAPKASTSKRRESGG